MTVYIYRPVQILRIGLKLLKVDEHKLRKQSYKSQIEDFKGHYGTEPFVLAQIWEDLQMLLEDPAELFQIAIVKPSARMDVKRKL